MFGAALVAVLGFGCAGPSAAAVATPGPGRAGGFFTYRAGSEQGGTRTIADRGPGYDVAVEPGTAHVDRLVPAVRYAVGQLRRYGIDVRFRGIDRQPLTNGTPPVGAIDVTETSSASSATCRATSGSESGAVFDASTVPSLQDVGVAIQVNSALVTFCPTMWASPDDYVAAIALHELGHAVGLGHYPGTYRGQAQVMNPIVPNTRTYRAGDIAGLRYVAAQTARLRAESALAGVVESWRVTRSGLRFSGWAVVGRTSEFATITATRDGRPVYEIGTSTARPDIVARTQTLWPDPGFDGAEVPMLSGVHRYCAVASVPGIPSQRRTLGCRSLRFPPPNPPPVLGSVGRTLTGSSRWPVVGIGAVAVLVFVAVAAEAVRRRRRSASGR